MNSIITKKGKVAVNFQDACLAIARECEQNTITFHPNYWVWSGAWATAHENIKYYRAICDAYGLKYELGNDAPRHGLAGDFITIHFDGRNKLVKNLRIAEFFRLHSVVQDDEFAREWALNQFAFCR